MDIVLKKSKIINSAAITISGSKSETNRLLLLQALFPDIKLENVSHSDDSVAMQNALQSNAETIDIGHAGTAMRFLTAYFAVCENRDVILTGSRRMQQRPVGILVDALRQLGAQITYLKNEGFPPLKITGRKITNNKIALRADVSSQFISALLLIAPKLEHGLELTLEGQITSRPYIEMTLSLLNEIGVATAFEGNVIRITARAQTSAAKNQPPVSIESDWSSASYFYSVIALSSIGSKITLSTFKENSAQGDSALIGIYKCFGVETQFGENNISIRKTENPKPIFLNFSLNNTPDLAQTIAVTAIGLGMGCELTGLHTLKIKETDRILALKNELEKLGATVSITDDSISFEPSGINANVRIETYDDHRMAMAFAPLALKVPIVIAGAEVVSKSYPNIWNDLQNIGFSFEKD